MGYFDMNLTSYELKRIGGPFAYPLQSKSFTTPTDRVNFRFLRANSLGLSVLIRL